MRVRMRVRALKKPYYSCHFGLLASNRRIVCDHGWRRGEWEPRRNLTEESCDDARMSGRDEVIRITHLRVITIAMHGGEDLDVPCRGCDCFDGLFAFSQGNSSLLQDGKVTRWKVPASRENVNFRLGRYRIPTHGTRETKDRLFALCHGKRIVLVYFVKRCFRIYSCVHSVLRTRLWTCEVDTVAAVFLQHCITIAQARSSMPPESGTRALGCSGSLFNTIPYQAGYCCTGN
jgi:hypothetical protein